MYTQIHVIEDEIRDLQRIVKANLALLEMEKIVRKERGSLERNRTVRVQN